MYGDDKAALDPDQKVQIIANFQFYEEYLRYTIKTHEDPSKLVNEPQEAMITIFRVLMSQISHLEVPVDKYLKIFFERFGYTSQMHELATLIARQFSSFNTRLSNLCTGPLEEVKKKIDEAREAQMSSMYS